MNQCIQHVLFTDVLRLSVPEVPSANTIGRGIQTADCRAPTRTNKTHFANICKGTPTRADHSRRQGEIGQAATFIKYQSLSAKAGTTVVRSLGEHVGRSGVPLKRSWLYQTIQLKESVVYMHVHMHLGTRTIY